MALPLRDTIRAVADAWTVPGPHPDYHEAQKANLAHVWPVLAAALDALAEEIQP